MTAGEVEIVRPSRTGDTLVTVHGPGSSPARSTCSPAAARWFARGSREPGEVIELDARTAAGAGPDRRRAERDPHARLHPPPRRADRAAASATSCSSARRIRAGTLRVKEFLTRNGHPYTYIDLDRDAGRAGAARSLSRRRRRRAGADLPRRRGAAQSRPTSRSPTASASTTRSIRRTCATWSIVGAGPAGLAAAVYGASEGLDVLVLEIERAGRTGRLELEDRELPRVSRPASPARSWPARAYAQAQKFGAQIMIAKGATRAGLRPEAVRASQIDDGAARAGARGHHRHGRRVPAAGARRTCRSSKAPASTTARRSSKRSSAAARRSSSSAAATPPGRPRCFSRRPPSACTCSSVATGWPTRMSRYLIRRIEENPAIALHTQHGDRRRSKATTTSSASAGATIANGRDRDARRSGTCS